MRLTVEAFLLQSTRVSAVLDHIGQCLDEDVSLKQLAEIACLSPSQLDRIYRRKVCETPLETLRRLRLQRALAQVRSGRESLTQIGLAAGYGSLAAFTHAFVRQFGCAPSQIPARLSGDPLPDRLQLVELPEREVLQLPYAGSSSERRRGAGILSGGLAVAGARRWRNWQVLDRDRPLVARGQDHVEIVHFVPAEGQPQEVRGIDRRVQAATRYAEFETYAATCPKTLSGLAERIREELGCQLTDARILRREINVSAYTAPQERRIALYLPVAPLRQR